MSGSNGGFLPARPATAGDERYLVEIILGHVSGRPALRRPRPTAVRVEGQPASDERPMPQAPSAAKGAATADAGPPIPEGPEAPARTGRDESAAAAVVAPMESGPGQQEDVASGLVSAGAGGVDRGVETCVEETGDGQQGRAAVRRSGPSPSAISPARPGVEGIVTPAEMAVLTGESLPAEGGLDPEAEPAWPERPRRRRWGGVVRLLIQLFVVAALAGLAVLLHLLTR